MNNTAQACMFALRIVSLMILGFATGIAMHTPWPACMAFGVVLVPTMKACWRVVRPLPKE